MYPKADVPVLQISMPSLDSKDLLDLGKKLAPLRDEGVLIMGSGFMTHGLPFLEDFRPEATPPAWSKEFDLWSAETLAKGDIALRSDLDVVAAAWPDRPTMPAAKVYEHTGAEAPHARTGKLAQVRAAMREAGATHHLISTVDDIAWLLNLRGADVGYNPVFLAHLLLDQSAATLHVGAGKIEPALAAALGTDGVRVAPYGDVAGALAALPATARLLVDPRRTTPGLVERSGATRIAA
jgi:Xaa-Pro aminopeptidase